MKPFRFRLERLARVRRVAEDAARAAWADAERIARAAEAAHEEAQRNHRRSVAELAECQSGRIDPQMVLSAQTTLQHLQAIERAWLERAQTARWQADRVQAEWQGHRSARRAIDKLEERDRQRHSEALQTAEQAETDEVASTRHARNRKNFRSDSSLGGPEPDAGHRRTAGSCLESERPPQSVDDPAPRRS